MMVELRCFFLLHSASSLKSLAWLTVFRYKMNCALMQNVVLFVGVMVQTIKGISFKPELSGFNGMNCQALQLELCIKELERNFFKFYKNLTQQKVVF